MTGTYITGVAFTAAQFGLDTIDYIVPVVDGSAAFTNGSPTQIAVDLTNNLFIMFGGGTSTATVPVLANPTTITGFSMWVLVYGVA